MAEAGLQAVHHRRRPAEHDQRVGVAAPGAPPSSGLPAPAMLVLAAVAAAVVGQGAYYGTAQRVVALLLAAAAAGTILGSRLRWAPGRTLVSACVALGAWALVSAALAGDLTGARSTVLLLAGVIVVVMTCGSTSAEQKGQLVDGIVVLGLLVALTGWAGVAWRRPPWTLEDQGLWRAATTLTYANAAAGLLAAVTLLSLARAAALPASPLMAAANCLLLTGLGATLSRGGFVAFIAGALTLAWILPVRTMVREAMAPAVGAAVALAGLLPSMPASSPARPLLAASTLAVGLLVAVMAARFGPWLLLAILLTGACTLALVEGRSLMDASGAIARPRVTMASPDRAHEARAALRLARTRPIVGVGPGRADLTWVPTGGAVAMARYAHNEYLQVLAELGVVGLGLVLTLFVVIGRMLRRARRAALAPELRAGVCAAMVALAVHGLFDFAWHLPAIALTGALLVGIVTTTETKEQA